LSADLSAGHGTIEHVFEHNKSGALDVGAVLLAQIGDAMRAESQAAARRQVSIADLYELRRAELGERADWAVDLDEAVAAEVAAKLRVTIGMGASYLRYARDMRERLPKLGKVFESGDIDYRLFQTVVFRTHLVTDPEALARLDAELAARARRWPSMTRRKLAAKIDSLVAKLDPDAVRRAKEYIEERYVTVIDTEAGMAELTARVFDTTGKAIGKRLDELAATVCGGDPRTLDQRRADALDALVAGADRLTCVCGGETCVSWANGRPPGNVVIHIVAEQASLDGTTQTPGVIAGSDALISAEVLREIAGAARHLPIIAPTDADPEGGYIPSRALADFVRCRDLTCRAPGCDAPAIVCDVDHTIPFGEGGPTHASNLKCLCRKHHLLKTFWGWKDEQLPDGTIIWTLPGGQRYVTTPGSALLFPSLCAPTGSLPAPQAPHGRRGTGQRTAMMPRRLRTRAENTAADIADERRRNYKARLARKQQTWARIAGGPALDPNDEPPPF
jgi:hypothetical protein